MLRPMPPALQIYTEKLVFAPETLLSKHMDPIQARLLLELIVY